ncbi:ABC transporter ATP-binding protein [Microbacterium sp. NPDC091662]|uniref:ABC transporter ATP-binding protein n=1 Tax=Microbacterium sp. NPDC091662 TaxID=3364211 RepID=UPI0037FC8E8B
MTASPDDRTAQVDQTEIAQEKASAKRAPAKKQSPEAASNAEKTARTPAAKRPVAKKPAAKKPAAKKPATARTTATSTAGRTAAAKASAARSGTKAAAEKAAPTADVVVEPLVKAITDATEKPASTPTSARGAAEARTAAAKNTAARSAASKSATSAAAAASSARTAAAKSTAAKTAASKTAASKSTAAKGAASKTAASKTAASKTAAAKAAASKAAATKSTARSAAAKSSAAKTAAAKSAAAKKAATKKAADEAAKAAAEAAKSAPEASVIEGVPVVEIALSADTVPPIAAAAGTIEPAAVAEPVRVAEPAAAEPVAAEPIVEQPVAPEPVETARAEPTAVIESIEAVEAVNESDDAASETGDPGEAPSVGEAISIRGLVKQFGDNRAVDGIDLTVPAGSFYGVVGPNGAGKTTTLSIVAGLLRADAGSVVICGIDQAKQPLAAKRLMGVLPDRLRTFDRLTGRQLLYYYGLLRGLAADVIEKRAADLARAFDLGDALSRVVSDYSAGMTKKIMLAGAMIHSPRVLVLDEPFESVDPVSSAVILDILRAYVSHGGTVILSSHGMDLVERVCSRVAIIVGGEVLAEGTIDEVRAGQTLEARFVELAGSSGEVEGLEWLHTFSD